VERKKTNLTPAQAKEKIYNFCAYQERTHQEVKNKLFGYGLYSNDVDELLSHLIEEGFLNEERFAKSFVGGKFRIKKWGRLKIVNALEARGITATCIRIGLKEIDEADYLDTLKSILETKIESLKDDNTFVIRDKAGRYAISRGYESELVWSEVKSLIP
jgi:regulatory protein